MLGKIAFVLALLGLVILIGACRKGSAQSGANESAPPSPKNVPQSTLIDDVNAVRSANTPLAVARLFCEVGDTYRKQDNGFEAGEAYDKAFKLGNNNANLCRHIGNARQAIDDTNGAEEAYERAKAVSAAQPEENEIRPLHADDYVALAEAYERLGHPKMAIAAHKKGIEVTPDSAAPFYGLGKLHCNQDRLDDALGIFLASPSGNVDSFESPAIEIIWRCLQTGRHEDALRVADFVISHQTEKTGLWHVMRAGALEELRRWPESLAAYQEALRLSPEWPIASLGMARVFKATGRDDNAEATAKRVLAFCDKRIELKPNSALYAYRGEALGLLNRWEDAVAAYEEALRQTSDPGASNFLELGIAYGQAGRFEEAISTTERAIALSPSWALAYSNLGWYYIELHRYEDAIAACNKALEIDPDSLYGLSNLGRAYYETDRHQEAIAAYEKAVRLYPDHAGSRTGLGKAHLATGNKPAALEQYNALKKLDPKQAEELKTAIDAA